MSLKIYGPIFVLFNRVTMAKQPSQQEPCGQIMNSMNTAFIDIGSVPNVSSSFLALVNVRSTFNEFIWEYFLQCC